MAVMVVMERNGWSGRYLSVGKCPQSHLFLGRPTVGAALKVPMEGPVELLAPTDEFHPFIFPQRRLGSPPRFRMGSARPFPARILVLQETLSWGKWRYHKDLCRNWTSSWLWGYRGATSKALKGSKCPKPRSYHPEWCKLTPRCRQSADGVVIPSHLRHMTNAPGSDVGARLLRRFSPPR